MNDSNQDAAVPHSMGDDAGPGVLSILSDKRKSAARRYHANHIPCGRLEEKMKRRPEEAVVQPCNRATGGFLARQQIFSPPQFFASDIPEYENARVINGHPPLTPQWDTHECRGVGQMR